MPQKKLRPETDADGFAVRLLCPAWVLKEVGALTPKDIAELCGIPKVNATDRAQRLAELIERNQFGKSKLERQMFEQFKDFIKNKNLR